MNVLDLFSGVGGFSLGLERAGFRTVAFCEIDRFCQAVLKANWPGVQIIDDVRDVTPASVRESVDVVCGGFPCQDISNAGHGLGLDGERSGLWSEYARIIGEFRPRFVIVENVSALLARGLGDVLGDLAALGYDAEWECVPASAVGAPHIRDRIWILAYPRREPGSFRRVCDWQARDGRQHPFPETDRWRETERGKDWELSTLVPGVHPGVVAAWWRHQSGVARTADGVPGQLERLGGMGNAVVPQIPEIIGRAIMNSRTLTEGLLAGMEPK